MKKDGMMLNLSVNRWKFNWKDFGVPGILELKWYIKHKEECFRYRKTKKWVEKMRHSQDF